MSQATDGGAIKRNFHRFSRWELARLWVSYQRYATLLFALALGLGGAGVYLIDMGSWYFGVPAGLVALKVFGFGVMVASRIPEKMRITAVAQRRIDAGRFDPLMVRDFCEDPCFRVMAHEVIGRAGIRGAKRRTLVREYTSAVQEESGQTLIIDHIRGQVFKVEGGQQILISSPPSAASPSEPADQISKQRSPNQLSPNQLSPNQL